uniref:cell wall anchor protein n=1 Tax=Mycobacterium tuberculosis TaxID=1773 RepID=UPI00099DED65
SGGGGEEPGKQTRPGEGGRGLRREEEPGNQTTPGDDARRLRREEEPGNQTRVGWWPAPTTTTGI